MTDIIPITPIGGSPALASAFGYQESDLTDGASLGFPVLSYRGKVWRISHKGNETKLMTPDGDPIPSVRVVILRANPNLSKNFYEKRYNEGDSDAPECFSLDGVRPDSQASKPQHGTCAGCPQAAWGSRVTEEGKEMKACADSRRLVVVPANDVANEALGGPMLLRVPAASLGNLVAFDDRLKKAGVAYFGIATKVAFDSDVAYPKLVFDYDGDATAALTAEAGQAILQMRDSEQCMRILSTTSAQEHGSSDASEPAAPTPAHVQEVTAPPPAAAPAPAPAPAPEPAAAPAPAPAAAAPTPAPAATLEGADASVLREPVNTAAPPVVESHESAPQPSAAPATEVASSEVDALVSALLS